MFQQNNKINVGRIPWNKGKIGVQEYSDEMKAKCSKAKIGNQYAKGSIRSEEHKQSIREKNGGSNSPYWKGGISRDRHGGPEYREWRSAVFERDDYTCQFCSQRGVYIEADHIKGWAENTEERYNIENGRTLCKPCHATTPNYKGRANKITK